METIIYKKAISMKVAIHKNHIQNSHTKKTHKTHEKMSELFVYGTLSSDNVYPTDNSDEMMDPHSHIERVKRMIKENNDDLKAYKDIYQSTFQISGNSRYASWLSSEVDRICDFRDLLDLELQLALNWAI
jgi:hypothetical protein